MRRVTKDNGFSLLELLIGTTILLVVSGSAFQALNYFQRSYLSTQLKSDTYRGIRSAMELMTQEVSQAGLLSFTPRTLSASLTANVSPQSVTLSSTTGIFVGEKLLIGTDASQEVVSVTAVNSGTITGIFTKNHASGEIVNALGTFYEGVLPSSTPTQLRLVGDLYGDGITVYGQYDCDATAGVFSRSVTPVSADSINPPQVLIAGVIPNPDGAPCFQYTNVTEGGLTFVTSVGVTITVRSSNRDAQTREFITLTESFLNIAPRNVLAGLGNAQANFVARLQPTPPNLPLP